jgi:hypothetical protein
MNTLARYIERVVEPTFQDFKRDSSSRMAFLTSVVIFHGIDRAAEDRGVSKRALRSQWRKTTEWMLVDYAAHHFKHVKSSEDRIPEDKRVGLPLSFALGINEEGDEIGQLRNFWFVLRDAIKFLRREAGLPP